MRDTLELLGYKEANTPADADLIWSWNWPFYPVRDNPKMAAVYDYLPRLKEHQVVNHVRGIAYMANKAELARLSSQLKWLPRSFVLPREYRAWQDFMQTPEGAKMDWLMKDKGHGSVGL